MVAAVLTLIWRQVPSVQELSRMLEQQELLWEKQSKSHNIVTKVSQFSSRAVWACFHDFATVTIGTKAKRPLPVAVKYAHKHFENIWIADGSTLEALFRKLESLQDAPQGKLAGKLCTVIDLLTRLPVQVWFHTNPLARYEFPGRFAQFHLPRPFDSRPWVYDFGFFVRLIAKQVDFITRIKSNAAFEVERILSSLHARDRLICFKTGDKTNHCYGCASSKSAKVKQCMVTPQC